ncbi:hypothetical protein BJ170DRAFT_438604 [Xylariales sp. AK1849]|nr:hypothetical protein BJ170DRAFT_438604 [Xylariales sp. AK1849]
MNLLPSLALPPSFQIGIRAVTRQSGRIFHGSGALQLSTTAQSFSAKPCCYHSITRPLGPSKAPRKLGPHFQQFLPWTTIRTVFKFRAIVHYTKLPDTYEDVAGLPFRKEDLNQREVNEIFGRHLTARDANALLKIIHGRRVAGTLDDPDLQHNTTHFITADRIKALEYLRKNIPVDEVINAGLRAEDELRMLEELEQDNEQVEQQHEETSPHSPPLKQPVDDERHASTPPRGIPKELKNDSPYGEGVFDRIRARNEAIQEAETKRLEVARIKREEEEALGNIGTLQTEQAKPREMSPWRQRHHDRASSDLEAAPEMKTWERLLPMAAMTILIIAGCVAFAALYSPPQRSRRLWPDIPPAAATCIGIILTNLAIWALWKFPPAWSILNRYMLLIPATPRPLQLVGAMFSHHSFGHLAGNMMALWFFGIRLHDEIGRGNFLALYFASGTLGFLASHFNLVLIRGLQFTTLGASGGIYGILAAFFWMHRYDEFKVFGYPPDPMSGPQGLAFLGLIIGLHLVAMFSKNRAASSLDIASHMGGMVAGAAGIELIQRHMDDKAKIRAEKLKTMGMLSLHTERKEKPESTDSAGP